LLNVGPTSEGAIPADSVRILKEVGRWMARNGESIYGTTASPLASAPSWGRITQKGRDFYLHVFDLPQDGELVVNGLDVNPKQAQLLAASGKTPLKLKQSGSSFTISLPTKLVDPYDTVVAVETGDAASK